MGRSGLKTVVEWVVKDTNFVRQREDDPVKPRQKPLGDKNMVGASVTKLRKLKHISQKELAINMQLMGIDINLSSLSKLEGQVRIATDKEIYAIARIFHISVDELFREL